MLVFSLNYFSNYFQYGIMTTYDSIKTNYLYKIKYLFWDFRFLINLHVLNIFWTSRSIFINFFNANYLKFLTIWKWGDWKALVSGSSIFKNPFFMIFQYWLKKKGKISSILKRNKRSFRFHLMIVGRVP